MMQYFYTAHWFICYSSSREETSKTEGLDSGNQHNRDLKMVRNGRHDLWNGDWLLMVCFVTLPPMVSTQTAEWLACETPPNNSCWAGFRTQTEEMSLGTQLRKELLELNPYHNSRLRKWVTTSTLYWSLIQSFRLPPNHWRSCCLQQ